MTRPLSMEPATTRASGTRRPAAGAGSAATSPLRRSAGVVVVMSVSLPGRWCRRAGRRYSFSVGATDGGRPGRMTGFRQQRRPVGRQRPRGWAGGPGLRGCAGREVSGRLSARLGVHAACGRDLVEPGVGGEELVQGEQVVVGHRCAGGRVLGVRRQRFVGGVVEDGGARGHQGQQGGPVEACGGQVGAAVAGPGDGAGVVGAVRPCRLRSRRRRRRAVRRRGRCW